MRAKVVRWLTIYLSLLVLTSCVAEVPSRRPASPTAEPLAAPRLDAQAVVFTDQGQYIHAFRVYVRRNLVIPPGTPESAGAAVEVVVSPEGEVRKLVITQSSGYPSYDQAVERAIFQAQPLPVMEEWVVADRSERLILKFEATE